MRSKGCLAVLFFAVVLLFLVSCEKEAPVKTEVSPTIDTVETKIDSSSETEDPALSEETREETLTERYGLGDIDPKKILCVGEGKTFATISDAVYAAKSGDVILVSRGTYRESVHAAGKKLFIIGEDRKKCILTHPNGDYFSPPLEMGAGMIANMTVDATGQKQVQGAIAKAYAMHVDYNSSIGENLLAIDVDFYNDDNTVLGLGLRENFTLIFRNCLIECRGDQTAFFCHDDPTKYGSASQRLVVENCLFYNHGSAPTLVLQSQEAAGSSVSCLWQNNQVVNSKSDNLLHVRYDGTKIAGEGGWLGMSFWKNEAASCQNTLSELNF